MSSMSQQLEALSVLIRILVLVSTFIVNAWADMIGVKETTFDFEDSEKVNKQFKWTNPEEFKSTENGLEWVGPRSDERNVRIELKEPMPVGWSWRTVGWVSVSITVQTDAPISFYSKSRQATLSTLHVRYSCDASNWTVWREVVPSNDPERDTRLNVIGTRIDVPRDQFDLYQTFLSEYQRLDVDWPSDEEAAVKWILSSKDQQFFEKYAPFIGYVQFAIETALPGSTPIRAIDLKLVYQAGGLHVKPKDKSMYEGRNGTWRFVAQPLAQDATATFKAE